jgi:choline dehydrogenase
MVWLRGQPADYDGWAQRGARGWDHASVLPYFQRAETAPPGATEPGRGRSGPVRITRPDLGASPLAEAFVAAGVAAGWPRLADFNGPVQEGFGPVERSTWGGRRMSVARTYLHPALSRRNLTVVTNTRVLHLLVEGQHVTGAALHGPGGRREVRASREVILAAGAIGSPHLLQLSGIGPAAALKAAGIPVRHDLPGVGENLNDHPDLVVQHRARAPLSVFPATRGLRALAAGVEWALRGTGPAATNHFEAGGFVSTRPGLAGPDIQYTFMPLAVIPGTAKVLPEHAFQVHIDLMRPKSRGHVRARSADPGQPPAILFNYLADPADRADLRAGLHILRDILSRAPMARLAGDEIFPGPGVRQDAEVDAWLARAVETCYHPVGTCRMGAAADPGAVVDPDCRLRGLEGLRIADASIMPEIVSANTNAATIMIAERAADLIRRPAAPAPG